MSEIDRVQSTTTFNEQKLLDGSFSNKGLQISAEAGQHVGITIKNMNTNELIASAIHKETKFGTANIDKQTSDTVYGYKENDDNTLRAGMLSKFYTFKSGADNIVDTALQGVPVATGNEDQGLSAAATAADFAALNAFSRSALRDVSEQRSDLGAIQNRLEYAIRNLDNVTENTAAAESAIRDTDIATEMVTYSNNSILQQAGTSMLSQANQSQQLALSLLG